MDILKLSQPLFEDAPCGPGLWAAMDAEFEEYYTGAQNRMPGFYAEPGVRRSDGSISPDKLFDPGSVKLADEVRQIDHLLARTRDLRLLALRARWESLAGRLPGVAEAVEAMAVLLETFPETVHPVDPSERREVISELNDRISMVQALQFAPLNGSTEVTLRKLRVARKEMSPLQSEHDLDLQLLCDALVDKGRRTSVEQAYGAAVRISAALERIVRACLVMPSGPMAPQLGDVKAVVADIVTSIEGTHPELRPVEVKPAPAADLQVPPSMPSACQAVVPDLSTTISSIPGAGPKVTCHDHARSLLEACETYYRRHEPSSAALLVVTQARLLIGRPLLEVIEVLMPDLASRAMIDFGPATGFALGAAQLKLLSSLEADQPDKATQSEAVSWMPAVVIMNPQEAADVLLAVEEYFRRVERSSPVPMLLQRARRYLNRDFQSLIDELVPRPSNA